ncbi:MAG: SGNH/GDSL hydrolase family protein [Bacteroidota bacterium]
MSDKTPRSKLVLWMQRHPRRALLVFNLLGILLVLVVVEGVLRNMGMQPGYLDMGHGDFRPLPEGEALRRQKLFFTDDTGIFRAFPDSFNYRPGYFVNESGFRNKPFSQIDTTKPRILFIGDSFTWGAHAEPIDESFVDLVARKGYEAINLGVPGTGPYQYAKIATRYIPRFAPEQVVVVFYMANDVQYIREEYGPGQNPYHITNAGWLNAFLDGPYHPTADSTYRYYLRRFGIPRDTWFNRFCAATVIGSRAWQLLRRLEWIDGWDPVVAERMQAREAALSPTPVSEEYLLEIDRLCRSRGIPMHLLVIPTHTELGMPIEELHPGLFRELTYRMPDDLVRSDYREWPDGHFNNAGHAKFAEFVRQILAE